MHDDAIVRTVFDSPVGLRVDTHRRGILGVHVQAAVVVHEERLLDVLERDVSDRMREPERRDHQRHRQILPRRRLRRLHAQVHRRQHHRVGDRPGRGQQRRQVCGGVRRVQLPGSGAGAERQESAGRQTARLRVRQQGRVVQTVHGQATRLGPGQTDPPRPAQRSRDVVRGHTRVRGKGDTGSKSSPR